MDTPALRYKPVNLPRKALHRIDQLPTTCADVSGFYRYQPDPREAPQAHAAAQKAVAAAATACAMLGGGLVLARWLRNLR